MPRYYFHVREGATLIRDTSGQELSDAEAARDEAIATGLALIAERGRLLHRTIEIIDETGHVVEEVSSRDILFHANYASVIQPTAENSPRR